MKFQKFKKCSSQYRSAPFWALNDKLEPEELTRQIKEMNQQGIGGFFMHPRGGLKDEYLGQEFLQAISACVEQAEELDMKAWLYDEDRFPSGYAGGKMTGLEDKYRQKYLEMEKMDCGQFSSAEEIKKIFFCEDEQENINSFIDVTEKSQAELNSLPGKLLVFRVLYSAREKRWNNQSYLDLSYKKAVDKFIEVTHEKYRQEFGAKFGNIIPGIFTDEPHFNVSGSEGKFVLPWTYQFVQSFVFQKEYSILDKLPSLFYDTDDHQKVCYDYWDVMSSRFVEGFSRTIFAWCEEQGINFTGHFWEHTFPSPKHTGSTMPNYEFMQIPGIDMLFNTEKRRDQVGNDLIVKEVSSVANQLGKERVLSETYGASGWELNFKDQKQIADWQLALGINLFCQHLSLYSLAGFRKRDFPQSFLDHQPWWDCYHLLGDYLGRASYMLSRGEYAADILVLHPSGSTWTEYDNKKNRGSEKLTSIEKNIKELLIFLSQNQYQYDLGDEEIISRHASLGDEVFTVGEMEYSTVIVPEMTVMKKSTFSLLKQFVKQEGRVILAGEAPVLLEGEKDRELIKFFNKNEITEITSLSELNKVLYHFNNQQIKIEDSQGHNPAKIYSHLRKDGEKEILFLCNLSEDKTYHLKVELERHPVEEWDPFTGERKDLELFKEDNKCFLALDFPPASSRILVIHKDKKTEKIREASLTERNKEIKKEIQLSGWQVERCNYNALTITNCRVELLDNQKWETSGNVVSADDCLRDKLNLDRGHIFAPQPWSYSPREIEDTYELKASYNFKIEDTVIENIYAAAEFPETFSPVLNGKQVEFIDDYYKDRAFALYDLSPAVRKGKNELVLYTDSYNVTTNIEAVYIVGDFLVKEKKKNKFVLLPEDTPPQLGGWVEQGYPFYSGKMIYQSSFNLNKHNADRIFLQVGDLNGVVFKFLINHQEVAIKGWAPYIIEISDYVKQGQNTIEVEISNSLQNLLGPHDYLDPEGLVTPGSFYSDIRQKFVNSGFGGQAEIVIYQ